MARMLPPHWSEDVKSPAEKRIFSLLRDDPQTQDWVCLHSLGLSRHTKQVYGEIDFVVLAPGEGVFCLEVKGGRVRRLGGEWTFTNRYGESTKRSKSPFMQARNSMFSLIEAIKRKFGDDHSLSRILFGYAVLFPDLSWEQEDPEYEWWQIYDRDFRSPISAFIRQLYQQTSVQVQDRYGFIPASPTKKDVKQLVDFFRGDFDTVVRPAHYLVHIENEMLKLTEEQYKMLDMLYVNERLLVEGAAGTGKTLLALEYSRREAREGRRVLLVCYNRNLAQWLIIEASHMQETTQIQTDSFFHYLGILISCSGFREAFEKERQSITEEILFRETYPFYALEALSEGILDPFDTLIVDEGQDLVRPEYLDVLDALLVGGLAGGRWGIFCDFQRQAIYSEGWTGEQMREEIRRRAPHYARCELRVNCRNTRPIGEETSLISGFASLPYLPSRVEGIPVDYRFVRGPGHQRQVVVEIVNGLLDSGITPDRITILSRLRRENTSLAESPKELKCSLIDLNEEYLAHPRQGSVTFSTIHSFKGLENSVIVLMDVNHLTGDQATSLLYVGMSRARHQLIVLLQDSAKEDYQMAVRRKLEKEMGSP